MLPNALKLFTAKVAIIVKLSKKRATGVPPKPKAKEDEQCYNTEVI